MSEPLEIIHLYIVREEEAQPVGETSVSSTTTIDSQPFVSEAHPLYGYLLPFFIMAAHLAIVLFALLAYLFITLTDTATITIIPKSYHLTENLTLSTIQSRVFQPLTLMQSRTVPATGKGHQDAIAATGTITLFNAATFEQTIDAGTLFIGSDGVHIVTDQTAIIEGATPPIEGQVTVSAHAVNPGIAGNIKAGDIQGACCRENIFVSNSQFTGGADQRDFTIVTHQDIQGVVSTLMPALTANIQQSFQKQVYPGEALTPNLCSKNISTNHNAGEEASQVTVTLRESCIAGAYIKRDFQAKVREALAQQAIQTIGTRYALSSYVQTSPTRIAIQQGRLVMSAIYQASMIYAFSQHDLTILRQQLAGKNRQQGITILSHLNGADHLTFQLEKNATFPTDPTHIHILIVT